MKDEKKSLLFNHTYKLAKLHVGKKTFYNEWVYQVKEDQMAPRDTKLD